MDKYEFIEEYCLSTGHNSFFATYIPYMDGCMSNESFKWAQPPAFEIE